MHEHPASLESAAFSDSAHSSGPNPDSP